MRKLAIAFWLNSILVAHAYAQHLECKSGDMTAYVEIETPWIGSPTIIVRMWASVLEFPVDVANTTHYYARERTSKLSRLSLHRMTGLMSWQFDTVKEDLPILVALCDNKITHTQCIKNASRMETANACSAPNLKEACEWWRAGMTLVRSWDFTCTPTTQKF